MKVWELESNIKKTCGSGMEWRQSSDDPLWLELGFSWELYMKFFENRLFSVTSEIAHKVELSMDTNTKSFMNFAFRKC